MYHKSQFELAMRTKHAFMHVQNAFRVMTYSIIKVWVTQGSGGDSHEDDHCGHVHSDGSFVMQHPWRTSTVCVDKEQQPISKTERLLFLSALYTDCKRSIT